MAIRNIISWLLRITAAVILFQTLYFKFTGQPESVELFTKLHAEPWGRIGSGVLELITGILLLIPSSVFIGAALAFGLMSGAILAHITVIGIESQGDGGQLFMLAIIVLLCASVLLMLYKKQGMGYFEKVFRRSSKNV